MGIIFLTVILSVIIFNYGDAAESPRKDFSNWQMTFFKDAATKHGTCLEICGFKFPFFYIFPPLFQKAFKDLPNLKTLYLFKVNLGDRLEKNLFVYSPNLVKLSIYSSNLRFLEAGVLVPLTNLRKLEIINVFLEKIEPHSFSFLYNLEELNLRGNRLKHLEKNVFAGLVNLFLLCLRNNRLKKIDCEIFNNMNKLKVLDIGQNRMNGWYRLGLKRELKKRLPNTKIKL